MINEVMVELKDILLGKVPRKSAIEIITAEPKDDERYPVLKLQEDPMTWYHGLVLHFVHLMYYGRMEDIDSLRQAHQIPKADFIRMAELGVEFFFAQKQHEKCLVLADYCQMDPGRMTKVFLHFFRDYLDKKEFENASKLWQKFRDKGVPKHIMHEEVKRVFRRVTDFRSGTERRNYQPMFLLVELFDIPKAITHWAGMEQYRFCMESRDYYAAALVAKNLGLHYKFSARAGYEAYKLAMNRFKDNISTGKYKFQEEPGASDPLNIAWHIIEEFRLLAHSGDEGNRDNLLVKNIQDLAYGAFLHIIGAGRIAGNAPGALHSFAVRLLRDYDLLNERANSSIAAAAKENVEKLIDDIHVATEGEADLNTYHRILKTLRMMYTGNYARFDPAAVNLIRKALAAKQVELAGEINKDFSCPLGDTTGMVLDCIYAWTAQDDYDSIITAVRYFPVQHLLKSNQTFMKSLRKYYFDTIAAQKYLKAITLSEAFHLDRKFVMNAIRVSVLRELGNGNLDEIRNIFRKYRVHRQEYMPLMQEAYLALLESKRDFAIRLRNEFGLGIFDIGFINWILHEVMRIRIGSNLEQKLVEEVEKLSREATGD